MKTYYEFLNESILNDNFWKWFGDSKVVDSNGNPLVVYHGTNKKFDSFNNKIKRNFTPGELISNDKFWFTDNIFIATKYANGSVTSPGSLLYPGSILLSVYLKISNPMIVDMHNEKLTPTEKKFLIPAKRNPTDSAHKSDYITEIGIRKESLIKKAIVQGNDGIIFKNGYDYIPYSGDVIAVFSPTQIKSIDNEGTWNPNDPNIYK